MAATLADIVESSEAERLATGFVFTEGPLWHPDGYLLFVDIRRSQIFKLSSRSIETSRAFHLFDFADDDGAIKSGILGNASQWFFQSTSD